MPRRTSQNTLHRFFVRNMKASSGNTGSPPSLCFTHSKPPSSRGLEGERADSPITPSYRTAALMFSAKNYLGLDRQNTARVRRGKSSQKNSFFQVIPTNQIVVSQAPSAPDQQDLVEMPAWACRHVPTGVGGDRAL